MPLQANKPSTIDVVWATVPSAANGATSARAPYQGRIVKLGVTVTAAVTTADAVCTCSITPFGTSTPVAITGGVVSVTQAGSGQGVTYIVIPTGANIVGEDDGINWVFSGGAAGGGSTTCFAEVRSGTL